MTDIQNKKLWTEQEDQTLRKAVTIVNSDKWNIIAKKFEELYFQTYGVVMRRAGKQCRERQSLGDKLYRWYNKLHPDLSRTLVTWSQEESVALLTIYQEIGPRWAKIIYRLSELGFDRRSDNNIKNHFHTMVKKSLKDLNQFIEQQNQKIKSTMISKRIKKTYFYDKTYSIEKMMRKHLQKKAVENDQVESLQRSNDRMECQKQKDEKSLCVALGQEKQQRQQQVVLINDNTATIPSANTQTARPSSQLLRLIDKKSIDRFWLWSAHKSTGRLEILSLAIEDTQLLQARNVFLQYMKHPQAFTPQQTRQLIESINNYTRCCKKLNKKKRDKFIKERQDKTKYYVEKIARRIFASVVGEQPQVKKIFVRNKGEIVERIGVLVTAIYNKSVMFMDEEDREKEGVISKKQEQKIAKQIVQEVMAAEQEHNEGNENDVENQPDHGKKQTIEIGIQTIELQHNNQPERQEQEKHSKSQKVKKIRKYNRKKPLQQQPKQNKQTDKLPSNAIIVIKQEQQVQKDNPSLALKQSQIKIQQPDFNTLVFGITRQVNLSQMKQKQESNNGENNKCRESSLGEVKVEDNFWSTIKMAEESEKTTEVNHNVGHNNQIHQQQHQAYINLQFNRPFEDKHIESENSSYSIGSRKSIRPNRNIFIEEKRFEQGQLTLQQRGSFGEIEKMFPDKLVRSIELGQGDNFKENQHMLMQQPKQQHQSNFMFFNQLPQLPQTANPFVTFHPTPLSPDPFCLFTNSRQFLINNSHFSNKVGSTQYQAKSKPKTPYNSNQFQEPSCENPFKTNKVEMNLGFDGKKQFNQQGNFLNNLFFENIRNVEENPQMQWKQPKVYDFQQQKDELPFPYSRQSKEANPFNPFASQPLDFEIPQKLIESVKDPRFPIKNYNDYSLNYMHANQLQYSKMFQYEKSFGLNSARMSQIDLFRSQERSSSHRSRSKDHEGSSNMFKSQRINSVHDSCQFSRSRHLSNSCTYSNNENKPYGSAKQIGQNSRN